MTTEAPGCTLRLKVPSAAVLMPLEVPRSNTVAPGMAPPSEPSTRPLMAVWAHAEAEHKHAARSRMNLK